MPRWSDLSLRMKGLAVVAIPLVALLVVGPIYFAAQRRVEDAESLVERTLEVRIQIDQVEALSIESSLRMHGYMLTGNRSFLQLYSAGVSALPRSLDELGRSVEGNPSQEQRVSALRPAIDELLTELRAAGATYRPGRPPSSHQRRLVLRSRETLGAVMGRIHAMEREGEQLLLERRAAAGSADRASTIAVAVSILAGLSIGIGMALAFARGVSRRIREVEENARRLQRGEDLGPMAPGRDEVARLGETLQDAAGLLSERQAELAHSEELYRSLARNFPNGAVALFDHDLRYTVIEGSVLDELGYSSDRFEGKTIWEALDPEGAEAVEPAYRAALAGRSTVSEMSSDGRDFLVHTQPIADDEGEVTAGMVVSIDITERKRAEAAARDNELFLDSIVEQLPTMIFVKDAEELRFVRFNRAGEQLIGHDRDELIGRNDYDFFPETEADFFTSKDREVLQSGGLLDIPEEPIQTGSGETRLLHTRKIPILDDEGRPRYLLGISEDITERKRSEEQLRHAKEEAERANSAKDEFLSRMSHELRTPLNAVLGFAQLLEMDDLSAEQHDGVRQILRGGRHLLGLIDEVLDISRIATGQIALSPEPVSVSETLQETMDLARPLARERDIQLRVQDADGLHVLADRQRLKQVLLNLVANGIKYNRPDGHVAVSWDRVDAGRLRIMVEDGGRGILAAEMERLFTPFDRLSAESSDVEGTGLGLALSRGLVEAMGGSISVDSVEGRGSTFTVELDLAESPLHRMQGELPPVPSHGHAEPDRTVLYIEDNPSNLALIERLFEARPDLKLVSAIQGRLGLELARLHRPDVILLDVHLPDMSGDEALRILRSDETTSAIPVILISADATPRQIGKLMELGAIDYLTKPLDIKRFLRVLDDTLGEHRRVG